MDSIETTLSATSYIVIGTDHLYYYVKEKLARKPKGFYIVDLSTVDKYSCIMPCAHTTEHAPRNLSHEESDKWLAGRIPDWSSQGQDTYGEGIQTLLKKDASARNRNAIIIGAYPQFEVGISRAISSVDEIVTAPRQVDVIFAEKRHQA